MSLKIVKRFGENWYIRGTLRGCRISESTGVSDRKVAEEIKATREAEILKQSIYGRAATATFAEAALKYLQQGGSTKFIEPVIQHFGSTLLAKIDQAAIEQAALKLYPNVTPGTRNRQVYTPTLAVLHHAARSGLLLAGCSQA